jgi:TRAP-type C4-dicarboxylate transport system substrate-binding protein
VTDRLKIRALTVGAVAAATLAGGCSLGGDSDRAGGERRPDPVVLTLANHEDSTLDLQEFALAVQRLSQGSLRIEFKNRWRESEVDYEPRTIEDVRDGKTDLAKVSARAFDVVGVKSLQPLVAPFAVDSYALQREVLLGGMTPRMLAGVERLDLVGIALLPGELRRPLGASRPLVGASDYRGATIATRVSDLGLRTFGALGATGKAIVPGADTSSFDGAELGLDGLPGDNYDGPARTLAANVSLWPRALAIVMNPDAYGRLTDDRRAALRAAGRAAIDPATKRIREFEREALGVICRRREPALRLATHSQLGSLRSATSSLTRGLHHDSVTRETAKWISALRARVDPEPAPTCPAPTSMRAAQGATPVDGLWRMDTTAEELARIAAPGDVVPENWGTSTFAVDSGRFALTTESRDACVWAYGSYAVEGKVVEWTVEDGGGISPNEFTNEPGERYTFGWSRYRDRLALSPIRGAISPEPMRVKPWRRLDDEPSLEALAERCRPPEDALQP